MAQPITEPAPDPDVAAAAEGDGEAFTRLYDRYRSQVFRIAHAAVRDWSLAEDITSETFTRAWRAMDGFRGDSFKSWLLTIARREVLKHFRYQRRHPEDLDPDLYERAYEHPAPDDTEWRAITRVTALACLVVIGQLPDRERCVLLLRLLDALTARETAEILGCPRYVVEYHQARALRRVRVELAPATYRPREVAIANRRCLRRHGTVHA
jgi:RNA polymerase sigma-70 factor, ECF subfamily